MVLFIKNSNTDTDLSVRYTTGLENTKVFVGLGNPGKDYSDHRHNIGFKCLDDFADRHKATDGWQTKKTLKSSINLINLAGTKIILVKPQDFMNNSGPVVQSVLNFYKVPVADLCVVYDDVDVNFGSVKTKQAGGSGGHNGLESIISQLGASFSRIRVGIGPKQPVQIDLSDFVLKPFEAKEKPSLADIIRTASEVLIEASVGPLNSQSYRCI